ncbi:MAG: cupin domain-containing protein [Actinobacteria bacterium]|nr:MAG: cupin domain-containing protein [Actinomycetota bacterium]
MAKRGDRLEMPDGSVYEVTRAAADTGGEFVEMQFTLPPGSVSPPPHVHQGLTEEYEVLEGKFEVMTDDQWRTLSAGESASVPSGAVHTFKNRSGALVRVRNVHRPPARFENYIEHIYRLMRAREIRSAKDPRIPIYLSMLMLEYSDTLAPGRARERIVLKALAGAGRLLRLSTDVRSEN